MQAYSNTKIEIFQKTDRFNNKINWRQNKDSINTDRDKDHKANNTDK